MKIHSNTLTHGDVCCATKSAGMTGVYLTEYEEKGSKSRTRRLDVSLAGTTHRRNNTGVMGAGDDFAASWDEWGMFINALFARDSNAIVGPYKSYAAFQALTDHRFDSLTAPYAHGDHKWHQGAKRVECADCSATLNDRLL